MASGQDPARRGRNLRTGWILASVALAGFLGVFLRYWLFR